MKKKLNIGIIGRNFGYNVIYKSIEKNKSFNVVGFSQKNKKLNQEIPKNIKIYPNWKNLILDKRIKAVIIATPPKLHKQIIEFAIKNNKHIFCDKPVTTSYNDISRLCKLLINKKITHFTNYEFANIEAFNFFKKKILNKILIKNIKIDWFINIPKKKRSNWKNNHSLGGGNYFNYICHTLYYLENFFEENGMPKYYHNKTYPIDIHCPAQVIVTLSKLQVFKENEVLLSKVLDWTLANMQHKKGYFYYQLKKGISSKIPYMRWSNAFMFNAMAHYLLETKLTKHGS